MRTQKNNYLEVFGCCTHINSVIPFGIIFGAIGIELGFNPYLLTQCLSSF